MDGIMLLKEKSVSANEAPWMNNPRKRLIRRRKKALTNNSLAEYNQLRNKVNRDRKACRAKYYDAKVKDLKACKPAQWWKEIKQLSGFSKAERASPIADLQTWLTRGKILNIWPMLSMTPCCHQWAHSPPLATPDVHAHAYVHQQEPPRQSQSSRNYRRLTRTKHPDLMESPLGTQRKRGLIGCTSGRHLEFFLFGASTSNFWEGSGHYTLPEDLTC